MENSSKKRGMAEFVKVNENAVGIWQEIPEFDGAGVEQKMD